MASTAEKMNESDDDLRLVQRAANGDAAAAGEALIRHRARLRRMVEARLDRRVRGRVDPSDVLQDGFADAVVKLPGYLADPSIPLFLWLRLVVGERLAKIHRDHLGAQVRDAGREVSLYRGPMPAASSALRSPPICSGRRRPPLRRPSGPSGCYGSRRRSTPSTRSTGKSCRCATSRS